LSAPDLLDRWRVFGEACKDKRLNQSSLAVLWAIADRINDSGEAWPSLNRIAIDAGCDRRTAARAVGTLTETGWLRVTPGTRTSPNRYRIGRGEPAPSGKAAPSGELVALGRGELAQKVGANSPLKPTHRTYPLNLPKEEQPAEKPAGPWGQGLQYLKSQGLAEAKARTFIGRLCREAKGNQRAGELLAEAERQQVADPQSWLIAAAKRSTKGVAAIQRDTRSEDQLAAAIDDERKRMGM